MSPVLRLRVVPAEGPPFDHLVAGDSLVLGRSTNCDLALADGSLSRNHARLDRENGRWMVRDLGSTNGTYLNGELVGGPTPLGLGDVLRLSESVVTLLPPDPPAVSKPGEPAAPALREAPLPDATVFRKVSDLLAGQERLADTAETPTQGEQDLRRLAGRLQLLNEVHGALARSAELPELLELILDRVMEHLQPEEAEILLKGPDGELSRVAVRPAGRAGSEPLTSRTLAREVMEKGLAALVLDAQVDERFSHAHSLLLTGVRSLLAAPLLDPEGPLGMILLSSRLNVRPFREEDMELLASLAGVAALRLRNVALAAEAAERRRLEQELALARHIQLALLPARLPEMPGWELLGANIPSRGVSGDYYEVVERAGGREAVLVVADVAGKGMGASLLTAALQTLAAQPIEDGLPPEEICAKVSRHLFRRTPPEKYATLFVGVLARDTGELCYSNAGHTPGLLVRGGGAVEELEATGPPVGLLREPRFEAAAVRLEPGDTLLLVSDGFVEAMDPDDQEYGLERLGEVLGERRDQSLDRLPEAIEEDLARFCRGVACADDRTLLLVRRGRAL
ncbi:MAG TPA: SpoIIE family protein phosphatase [Thermoanaerobaculia bacterium]|nr:SpoIIE family protein phosphatase [Thermoanaerobaculia bacterium]